MPILIRRNSTPGDFVSPSAFLKEEDLELLLTECRQLFLPDDGNQDEVNIEFVTRQLDLEAGRLDLLFVDSTGLPIAVEVKLALNDDARRKVVAQAIDYLSSLTELTVDELDKTVGGKLGDALMRLADDDPEEFDRLWDLVGTNLRAGRARLVVALDEAPASLERIFRFLAHNSKLDVQLLTLQRYSSDLGDVVVPQIRVNPATERRSTGHSQASPLQELMAAVDAYNASVPADARATGNSPHYRAIRFFGKGHYLFSQGKSNIRVMVRSFADTSVQELLKSCAGKPVGNGQGILKWDDAKFRGLGTLEATFPLETPAETVAQAMRDLIKLTKERVDEALAASERKPPVATGEKSISKASVS
jgi:hypothetical protein